MTDLYMLMTIFLSNIENNRRVRDIDFLLNIVTVSHWSTKSRTKYNRYQHRGQREYE